MQEEKSHKQILKSTGIVGGSQIASILIGIIRTKIVAVLLGPVGIGYIGVLQNIIDLVRQTTGFGINFSGIKDVAESNATNDNLKISRAIKILKTWAFWTGILGTVLTIIFCVPLSNYSFGSSSYAISIAIISVTILIASISGGQLALLQGLRKINLMAKASFYGAVLSTIITIPMYWMFGIDGIVPGMVLTSLGSLVLSWWYTKDIKLEKINLSIKETFKDGSKMARLGFFITITGILATITLYIVRSYLLKKMNINAVGCFQACWTISTLYLGIILNAMLADFFPRLTEVNKDDKLVNRLINEQLEIAFLIASPMIVFLIVFAHLIVTVLYSKEFIIAIPILQWLIAGTFFTIVSWPLGVMFLAKSKGIYSFLSETLWNATFITMLYLGWDIYGFSIVGYSFVVACLIRFIIVYCCTRHLSNFKFNKLNVKYGLFFGFLVIIALINVSLFSETIQYIISLIIILTTGIFSYINLNKIMDISAFVENKIRRKNK
ncbi:O-antigen translocase [Flavobacterium johnsoniae]|uniref:Membrane protein involved in the export of O-antigen and teichoic acid n=1 Tax=Flavobacterium johnsoniae TaxID=986 RepID=A0A1M5L4P9_FLAJO|nr:O-antigen translocase [Flavobacterium johnsoniae]SHG59930.1 Membrane protein involved in the export of O-antigen and teichoic acid [Flavobacterium johnsoniae]